jgi:hypothetical protein
MPLREFRQPLFLALALLYALARYNRLGGHLPVPPMLNSYLADVACLPLQLTLALAGLRHWYFRRPDFVLPPAWIVSAWLVTSVWFELVLPRWRPAATAWAPGFSAAG